MDETAAPGAGMGAIPMIGMGLQVLGAGASIIQGIQAKRAQREAEAQAQRALDSAKQKLSVNRMEGLEVPLDAYELAERGLTAQQMQGIQALSESDPRSLAAGVGRSQMAAQEGQEALRQRMAQDIYNRDKLVADEQSRIDRTLGNINLQEAEGAQLAAMQREQMAAAGFTGAINSLGNVGQTLYENSALYGQGRAESAAQRISNSGFETGMSQLGMADYMNNNLSNPMLRRAAVGQYNPFSVSRLEARPAGVNTDFTLPNIKF